MSQTPQSPQPSPSQSPSPRLAQGLDRNRFFAYNLWLEQRGLSPVTYATYQAMFTVPQEPRQEAKQPRQEAKQPPQEAEQPPQEAKQQAKQPRQEAKQQAEQPRQEADPGRAYHLICWLDDGGQDAVSDQLATKIKKATCVPLSYMSSYRLPPAGHSDRAAEWQRITTELAAQPPAAIAIWAQQAPTDLPEAIRHHPSLWQQPHPSRFSQAGVKGAFWQQLQQLMAAVAQHPSL